MKNKDLYNSFGVDEIYSEKPINKFNDISNISTPKEVPKNSKMKKNISNSKFPIDSVTDIVNDIRNNLHDIGTIVDLANMVKNFNKCSLKKLATNTVFSDGDEQSDIMIIGEAPGNNEDLQGIPFCGDSGKLLNDMFESIGINREKLYISNMVFWRPPGNRNPTKEEIAICLPFVEKHIYLKNPKILIFVGAVASQNMLNLSGSMTNSRGKFFEYKNQYIHQPIKAIPIFHPSYLMRQPSKKKIAWQDCLKIKSYINGDPKTI